MLQQGISREYQLIASTLAQQTSYFVVLFYRVKTVSVRNDDYHSFSNSIMGRGLLSCQVALNSSSLENRKKIWSTIGTVHLESFVPSVDTSAPRQQQLATATQALCHKGGEGAGIYLMGDLNWKDPTQKQNNDGPCLEACRSNGGGCSWKDAWVDTHNMKKSEQAGFTLDGKLNGMLTYQYRSRIDRCLYTIGGRASSSLSTSSTSSSASTASSSSSSSVAIAATRLLGTVRIQPEQSFSKTLRSGQTKKNLPVFPSDHFGLQIDVHV